LPQIATIAASKRGDSVMTAIEVWSKWYRAFEQCAIDGDWMRLKPLMSENMQYRVAGVPFACVLVGPQAICEGFARSFKGFDNRFDRRVHRVVATRLQEPAYLEAWIEGRYEKEGLAPLTFPAIEQVHIDGDRIGLMVDVYDPSLLEVQAAFAWLEQHGASLGDLDPGYS
jgi:hypothetical protein